MTDETISLTSTLIFDAPSWGWSWHKDMLTAIASARALGVPRFEINVTDEARELPDMRPAGSDYLGQQKYEAVGTRIEPFQRVRVYAIRVEASDDHA
jgi:hypothetical protein